MIILLSYPHSGSSWIRYMVEFVTKKPTRGAGGEPSIGALDPSLGVSLEEEYFLYKRTQLAIHDYDDEQNKKLIFLIRNYKDTFIREAVNRGKLCEDEVKRVFNNDYAMYVSLIHDYKDWKGPKILVHYEDLIDTPGVIISRIFEFLGISDKSEFFLDHCDKHYSHSLDLYKRAHSFDDVAEHEGDKVLSKELRKHMDTVLLYHDPMIFANYLSEYMEVD